MCKVRYELEGYLNYSEIKKKIFIEEEMVTLIK